MTEINLDTNQDNGREFRTVTASTKVTDQELAHLESAAAARGVRLGEWIRDVLLRAARPTNRGEMELHIFTELVGIQMLLMSTLEPLLRGDRLTQEQLASLFRRVQTTKATQAQELLAKRSQNREK